MLFLILFFNCIIIFFHIAYSVYSLASMYFHVFSIFLFFFSSCFFLLFFFVLLVLLHDHNHTIHADNCHHRRHLLCSGLSIHFFLLFAIRLSHFGQVICSPLAPGRTSFQWHTALGKTTSWLNGVVSESHRAKQRNSFFKKLCPKSSCIKLQYLGKNSTFQVALFFIVPLIFSCRRIGETQAFKRFYVVLQIFPGRC